MRKWTLSLSPCQLPNSDCAMSATLTEMDDVPSKLNRLITGSHRLDAALMQLPRVVLLLGPRHSALLAGHCFSCKLISHCRRWHVALYKQISLTATLSLCFLPSCITCTSSLTLDPGRPLPFPFACKCALPPNRYNFYQFFHNSYSTLLVIRQRQ